MTYFPEQLSAAGTRQIDAQIGFMRVMTAQALATASQVWALNISTSRASIERAANTVRQLSSITDPRDLFTLGSQTQEQLGAMFAYSRELFNIANDARLALSRQGGEQQAGAPEQPAAAHDTPKAADEQPQAKASAPAAGLQLVPAQPHNEPPAAAKPIAKAVRKVAGKRTSLPVPAASPVATQEASLPTIDPADVAPVLELKAPRSRRKK